MARFDVYAEPGGFGFLLDCQADLLSGLSTRFMVPLMPREEAPVAGARLNPVFLVEGVEVAMVTQFAGAVSVRDLGERVMSLDAEQMAIMNALDMLMIGY
jgi:toxin CcdB